MHVCCEAMPPRGSSSSAASQHGLGLGVAASQPDGVGVGASQLDAPSKAKELLDEVLQLGRFHGEATRKKTHYISASGKPAPLAGLMLGRKHSYKH